MTTRMSLTKRSSGRLAAALMALAALASLNGAVLAQSLMDAAPADAVVAVHKAVTDKDDFIEENWGNVFKAFHDSNILPDAYSLLKKQMPPSEAAELSDLVDKVGAVCRSVDWASLHNAEFLFTMTWDPGASTVTAPNGQQIPKMWPSQVYAFRMTDAAAAHNGEVVAGLFQDLVDAVGGQAPVTIASREAHGAAITSLDLVGMFQFSVARRGDVMILSWGDDLLDPFLGRLSGEDSSPGLSKSERFTSVMKLLPKADTETAYVDFGRMMGAFSKMMGTIASMDESPDEEGKQALSSIQGILDNLLPFDRIGSTTRIEGRQTIKETAAMAIPGHENTIIGKLMAGQRTFGDFEKYVPKDAKSFFAWSGVNPLKVYEAIVGVVGEFPGGAEGIAEFEAEFENGTGMNFRDGVLGWIGGEMVAVNFQSPPMGGMPNSVLMIGLRDSERALDLVSQGIALVDELAKQNGQPGLITDAAPGLLGEWGFITITHPQVQAMGLSITLGAKDDFLFLGFTPQASAKVADTMAGKAPSILESKRFQREGVAPEGDLTMVAYSDVSGAAAEAAMSLGMVGLVGGMIPPNDPGADVARELLGMVQRLSPVVMAADFFKSNAGAQMFDGVAYRAINKTTYKSEDGE